MTTHTTATDRRPWWRYLGPWPLYPVTLGILTTVMAFVSQVSLFTPNEALPVLFNSVIFGVIVGGLLWLAKRFLPSFVATGWGYAITITAITAIGGAVRLWQGVLLSYEDVTPLGQFGIYFWRALPLIFGMQILIGASRDRLQRQITATEAALRATEQQSAALLRADEEIRRSVAIVLHDRVQAGLLAACLRLQLVRDGGSPEDVQKVIDDLEELRSIDVRRAVRALSPNLQDLDLQTALDDLADAYRPAVDVTVTVGDQCSPDPQARLAVYRIAEQAVMNAVAHGQAHVVRIDVDRMDGYARATITDDGVGVRDDAAAGFGTTLIDTWCRTLSGSWTRTPRPEGGTTVTARIPQRRATDALGTAREP